MPPRQPTDHVILRFSWLHPSFLVLLSCETDPESRLRCEPRFLPCDELDVHKYHKFLNSVGCHELVITLLLPYKDLAQYHCRRP
jgi:hypothetical protein